LGAILALIDPDQHLCKPETDNSNGSGTRAPTFRKIKKRAGRRESSRKL
jgi:hypothetical protein